MRRMMVVVVLLVLMVACRSQDRTPWIPVLEQSDYVYLTDTLALALERLPSSVRLQEDPQLALEDLASARHELLKMQHYYLPLTEARQLVYDADRLLYLGQPASSRAKLEQCLAVFQDMGRKGGPGVQNAMDKAGVQVERLLPLLDGRPVEVADAFRVLGESINLMLLKGDLVLAGAVFSGE